jgi:hypothetical protein
MATDIIDVLGIASDTIDEHCFFPEAMTQNEE